MQAAPMAAEAGPTDLRGRVAEPHEIRAQAVAGPGEKATEAQHAMGKPTARERIELLLDSESVREVEQLRRHRATGFDPEAGKPYTDGVVTRWGTVEGRTVLVHAHDFRIYGGALLTHPPTARPSAAWSTTSSTPPRPARC